MTVEPAVPVGPFVRRGPLSGWESRLHRGSRDGAVVLEAVPFLTQVGLRVPPAATTARTACASALGLSLPEEAGRATSSGDRAVLWLGPDEWLVTDDRVPAGGILDALRDAVGEAHGSVIDLSANRTVLQLSGPFARDVLESGCRLDLHERAFATGSCAATDLVRASIYLHRVDAVTYRLFVRPSFAAYLTEWLLDAMQEHVHPS